MQFSSRKLEMQGGRCQDRNGERKNETHGTSLVVSVGGKCYFSTSLRQRVNNHGSHSPVVNRFCLSEAPAGMLDQRSIVNKRKEHGKYCEGAAAVVETRPNTRTRSFDEIQGFRKEAKVEGQGHVSERDLYIEILFPFHQVA